VNDPCFRKITGNRQDRQHASPRGAPQRRSPALPAIICDIFDAAWLLEIEAVAAA
jgi:hypothetical protein